MADFSRVRHLLEKESETKKDLRTKYTLYLAFCFPVQVVAERPGAH